MLEVSNLEDRFFQRVEFGTGHSRKCTQLRQAVKLIISITFQASTAL